MFTDLIAFTIILASGMIMLYIGITSLYYVINKQKNTQHEHKEKVKKDSTIETTSKEYIESTINNLSNTNLELDKEWKQIREQLKNLYYVSGICKQEELVKFYKYQNIFKEIHDLVEHAINLNTYNNKDLIDTVKASLELPVEEILHGDVTTRIIAELKKETKLMEDIKANKNRDNLQKGSI